MEFNLDNLRMNAVETDRNGVIDARTVFRFHQTGAKVHAEYAGGEVERGFLVGLVEGARLTFRYCQLERGGALNGGASTCELQRDEQGRVQIVEHFEWESRSGGGRNVIRQMG